MATVKVLLREDIEHLGRRGELIRVKAGFARNYLLPRRLAMVATSSNVKAVEQERVALQRRELQDRRAAHSLSERLKEVTLEFVRKASDQGVFYGSVTLHDIAQALAERGLDITRRHLHLEAPIKQPGTYALKVKLHRDVAVEIPITAKAEGQPEVSEGQPGRVDKSGPDTISDEKESGGSGLANEPGAPGSPEEDRTQ